MIKFNLGRIPVQVHFSHLVFSAILALGWPPSQRGGSIAEALATPGHPAQQSAQIIWVLSFVVMAFVAILFHELGHASVSMAFGYKPSIELVFMGGLTRPNANETIPWFKNVALTVAGPLFGLLLGLIASVVAWLAPAETNLYSFAHTFALMNVIWSIFNLMPVYPMDGGLIANSVLQRMFDRRGFLLSQVLTLVTLGLLALFFFSLSGGISPFTAILFVMWGMRAVANIQGYLRGELPPEPNHPTEVAYREAVEHYKANRLDKAAAASNAALTLDMAPSLRSKFHYLLGWISVKEGEGRSALDHFSQVQGQKVEPHALGAAFSLVGDETRALPLWELAYKETQDPTILHEWAGSLIRAGREEDARRMPGVEMGTAFRCAERLLFIRGDFAAAAQVGLRGLDERPSANTAYDVACAFARAGVKDQAVRLLQRAVDLGFGDYDYASSDSDLATLHGHPGFAAVLDAMRNQKNRVG